MTASTASVPHFRMYIGGQWVDTDDRYELANPANEQLVATAARGPSSTPTRRSPRLSPRTAGGSGATPPGKSGQRR